MKKIVITTILLATITLSYGLKFLKVYETEKQEQNYMEEQISNYLNGMSLEEKIGQMLMISNRTPTMTSELNTTLNHVNPGGFIFFAENFTNQENSKKLIKDIIFLKNL